MQCHYIGYLLKQDGNCEVPVWLFFLEFIWFVDYAMFKMEYFFNNFANRRSPLIRRLCWDTAGCVLFIRITSFTAATHRSSDENGKEGETSCATEISFGLIQSSPSAQLRPQSIKMTIHPWFRYEVHVYYHLRRPSPKTQFQFFFLKIPRDCTTYSLTHMVSFQNSLFCMYDFFRNKYALFWDFTYIY